MSCLCPFHLHVLSYLCPKFDTMKRILLIFALGALAFLLHAQNDSLSKVYPLQTPRVANFDVQHVILDLHFDWQKKQAIGKATLQIKPLAKLGKIYLDAANLSIESIVLNDKSLKYNILAKEGKGNVEIFLDKKYKKNETIAVEITYKTNHINDIDPNNLSGSNGKGLRFSQASSHDQIKPFEVYAVSELESAKYWFPCLDVPNDWHTTEFFLTVDKKLTALANGNLMDKKENNDGTHTFYFKTDKPHANHLTTFVVSEYVDVMQRFDNVVIHNLGYKHEVESTEATVVRLPDMMRYFSELTGVKYPYLTYNQAFVQDMATVQSGVGFSAITENMVDDKSTHDDYFYLWDLTEAEALATQWFGVHIACKDYRDLWLNKSLAHYLNLMYCEHRNGSDEFLTFAFSFDKSTYLTDWNNGHRRPIVTNRYTDDTQSLAADNYVYGHGAEVLHLLRKQMGDEKFKRAIQLFATQNAGKSATTEDFIKAVNEANGESLDWFFKQWLFNIGHPVFEVTKQYDKDKKQLILNVKQTQEADNQSFFNSNKYFKGKAEVEIDSQIYTVFLEDKMLNTFSFDLKKEPFLVNFDYQSAWIKEMTFEKTLDEYLFQLEHDKDILGRQDALGAVANLAQTASESEKEHIKNIYRKVLSQKVYWRLKNALLFQLRSLMLLSANGAIAYDDVTKKLLLDMTKTEKSWLKASVLFSLGMSKDTSLVDLYIENLDDESFRVINSAANALGKSKSAKAFAALEKLTKKPSMKSQSLLCAFNGLKELGDQRAFDIYYNALKDSTLLRWRLPNGSIWDYRVIAVANIAAMGRSASVYPLLRQRFDTAIKENNNDGIFNICLLITTLGDAQGQEIFPILKQKFKDDANALKGIAAFEEVLKK